MQGLQQSCVCQGKERPPTVLHHGTSSNNADCGAQALAPLLHTYKKEYVCACICHPQSCSLSLRVAGGKPHAPCPTKCEGACGATLHMPQRPRKLPMAATQTLGTIANSNHPKATESKRASLIQDSTQRDSVRQAATLQGNHQALESSTGPLAEWQVSGLTLLKIKRVTRVEGTGLWLRQASSGSCARPSDVASNSVQRLCWASKHSQQATAGSNCIGC